MKRLLSYDEKRRNLLEAMRKINLDNMTKHATKTFKASCGHRVQKGETYFVAYNNGRETLCARCNGAEEA